ncbi:MAG: hypothetical protein GY707_15210, partial [Desulfobacteraceae bacterium]|nr:hypothetical protein [Desulfobacteraceae bacterium]
MADTVSAYKILALGPFSKVPEEKFKPNFVKLDLYSIDDAVKAIAPVLYLPMSTDLCSESALTLKFSSIKDFKANSIFKNNPFLQTLSQEKKPAPKKVQEDNAVDDILSMVDVSNYSTEETEKTGSMGNDNSRIMQEIFSNIEFQKTESAWRGVQNLVKQAQIKGFNKISVSVSPVSDNSLEHVLDAVELLPFEEAPNLILIDLGFDNTMPSIELLGKVIEFADKMMVPVCINLKPDFFRIDSFNQLDKLQYINNYLDDASYAKFRKLRELAGASFLIANCNRFAVRDANDFESQPLSVSSVWAVGTLCAKAVSETGWPMKFTRYTEYTVDDLPMFNL